MVKRQIDQVNSTQNSMIVLKEQHTRNDFATMRSQIEEARHDFENLLEEECGRLRNDLIVQVENHLIKVGSHTLWNNLNTTC